MAAQNFDKFRPEAAEHPPSLTLQKDSNSPHIPISFAQHNTQSSVSSSETTSSFCSSDEPSYQSSATESDSTDTTEKASDLSELVPDTPTATSVAITALRKMVDIKYKLEVYDTITEELNTVSQDDEAFDLSHLNNSKKVNDPDENQPAIFEVITQAVGFDRRRRKTDFEQLPQESNEDGKRAPDPKLPPPKFEDLKVTEVEEVRIEIHSQGLLEAIRSVVDYYPYQNLSGDIVIMHEPYWILIHHNNELQRLYQELSSPHKARFLADKEIARHLGILLEFVQPQIDKIVPPVERRLQNKVPTITFDALWYILRPGTLAYCQYAGEWIVLEEGALPSPVYKDTPLLSRQP